ncbi:helix-turn-helix domain-containing protein [uncultured Gemmiger sp.]|uniref:helix-turn-helix domain-containing protein n=1 Tax=uncultured Gemmiger sp. TaxID=1623490 RepID=UPI0025DBB01B|nr:helix-turn-helix domain-containing protein [uncultured Gemmiger sp.]
MISFRELLINAKNGDEKALMEMFDIFRPMTEKASRNAGRKDENLYDVIVMAFIQAISKFPIDKP